MKKVVPFISILALIFMVWVSPGYVAHPLSLRRTSEYASLLRISGALHLGIFEQPEKNDFFG